MTKIKIEKATESYQPTISIVGICGNEPEFVHESLMSVMPIADEVVLILDKEKIDKITRQKIDKVKNQFPEKKWKVEEREWDTGTKQKQYAYELATQDYVLFLDLDEVFSDNVLKIKEHIRNLRTTYDIFHIRSHHFIYNLQMEDDVVEKHFHRGRLIPNDKEKFRLRGINHAILAVKEGLKVREGTIEDVRIFHFGYVKQLYKIIQKFEKDMQIKQMHDETFLVGWKNNHILGTYPIKKFGIINLPTIIKKKFHIEYLDDLLYFKDRAKMEPKFYEDAIEIKKQFNPKKVLLCGCGAGQRVYCFRRVGIDAAGFDKSEFIVKKNVFKIEPNKYFVGDVTDEFTDFKDNYDLVIAYDLMEHLDYEQLDTALKNIFKWGTGNFIFSIPFKGDPNLDGDPTHIIKEDKEWWLNKLKEAGFKIVSTPETFPFKEQIIVAKKEEKQ